MSQTPEEGSLRDMLRDSDAEHFVGRQVELETVAELLDGQTPSRILFVHGPGGIGKSALLRMASRMAEASSFVVQEHDARSLSGGLDDLLSRITGTAERQLFLVIDEVDQLGASLAPMRDALLDRLPADARIVLAGRGAPERSWRDHGLPSIVIDLPLDPLEDESADEFLARRGISDPARRHRIVGWARGYPLALTVAVVAPGGGPGTGMEARLEERLTTWLAGGSILDLDREVLEVAAIARVVNGRLLAAALPGRNTREILPCLQASPVVEPLGSGISMHPVLAEAIRGRLKVTAPQRYRHLVRRIAMHLSTRAQLGDMDALLELSTLIEDPQYRRAIANEASLHHYADSPRVGELEAFGRAHGFNRERDWAELCDWQAGGGASFVIRRTNGEAALWVSFAKISELRELGPIAASQLAVARRLKPRTDHAFAVLALFADGTADERDEVSRLASGAFMQQAGVPDLDLILTSFPEPDRGPDRNAIDTAEVSDAGPRTVRISDFRPLGAVSFVEAIVLGEQGFEPRGPGRLDLLATTEDPEREAQLRAVLDEAFDDSPKDRRLRAVIEAAHLGPPRAESTFLSEFHVGRSTWYRMLRTARERVLAHRG